MLTGTLEQQEDWPASADAASAFLWPPSRRDVREPAKRARVIAMPGRCWCGEVLLHGWPGKTAGAPHPRVKPEGLRHAGDDSPPTGALSQSDRV